MNRNHFFRLSGKAIYLIIFLFSLTSQLYGAKKIETNLKLYFSTYYNNNIIKLSPEDIDEFKQNLYPDRYKIKSVDDIIFSSRAELSFKHLFAYGHTQIDKFIFQYDKYYKNSFRDFKFISLQVKQYFSRFLNFSVNYYYYPFIYINQYKSEIEPLDVYREFSYAKSLCSSGCEFNFNKLIALGYRFIYSQNYYNKYFPCYDSYDFRNDFWVEIFFDRKYKVKISYSYTSLLAEAENAFNDYSGSYKVSDPSYDSNIYYFSILFPINFNKKEIRTFFSFKLTERYFQSCLTLEEDPFHVHRKDNIYRFNSTLIYPLSQFFELKGFFKYRERITNSPLGNYVEDEKNYYQKIYGVEIRFKI